MKNIHLHLRLLAAVALLTPAARLLANPPDADETISFRNMTLDMMEKDAREASARAETKANRKKTPPPPSALAAVNFDANHDGKLDDAEFAKWMAAVRSAVTKSPEAMKRFDKNHDGKLDDAEWTAASTSLFGPK